MPIPYARPETESATRAPRLVRARQGRRLAGVCAGLAEHLGAPVGWVRVVFVLLTLSGGAGLLAYGFLWVLVPDAADVQGVPARVGGRLRVAPPVAPADRSVVAESGRPRGAGVLEPSGGPLLLVGGFVVVLGLVLAVQRAGVDVRAGFLVPALTIGAGVVLAWSQLDEARRAQWLGEGQAPRGPAVARILVGGALAVVGIVVLATRGKSIAAVWDAGLAVVAVLVGAVLIAAPWVLRLWGQLRAEQLATARANERADIAAHLHDSVLQTLALIQRRADDPTTVAQLARAQERELRTWLYASRHAAADTLAGAVREVVAEVEDNHGATVELVLTGDVPLDPDVAALVKALREALLNAVRHGRPPVTAYVEASPARIEAFVRDRGDGFDLGSVAPDRHGVRDSILARMERHGGSARVRILDQGTEVALTLPAREGVPAP